MRLALMADIHSNREAFSACLQDARRRGFDRLVLLGDYVGYGADPVWTMDAVMEEVSRGAAALRGNHDNAIADERERMNDAAHAAITWTRGQIGTEARAFLASLPLRLEEEGCLFTHAGGPSLERWRYVIDAEDAATHLSASTSRLSFCGHVHVPAVFGERAEGAPIRFRPVSGVAVPLLRQRRWVAVLGSVGQPRDGDPGASYALLEVERGELTYIRVPYDIDAAAEKIRRAGLPDILASRLSRGH